MKKTGPAGEEAFVLHIDGLMQERRNSIWKTILINIGE